MIKFIGVVVLLFLIYCLGTLLYMWVWNASIADYFHWAPLGFWQAMGLAYLTKHLVLPELKSLAPLLD